MFWRHETLESCAYSCSCIHGQTCHSVAMKGSHSYGSVMFFRSHRLAERGGYVYFDGLQLRFSPKRYDKMCGHSEIEHLKKWECVLLCLFGIWTVNTGIDLHRQVHLSCLKHGKLRWEERSIWRKRSGLMDELCYRFRVHIMRGLGGISSFDW